MLLAGNCQHSETKTGTYLNQLDQDSLLVLNGRYEQCVECGMIVKDIKQTPDGVLETNMVTKEKRLVPYRNKS